MANINIKRYNGDAWEIHYPKTTIGQVINLSSQLANMQSDIDEKANLSDVQTALNEKAATSHTHSASQITSGTISNSRLPSTFVNLTDGKSNLPYKGSIVIYGDSDKYYPVHFAKGDQNLLRTIKIWRSYHEQAPSDWYTSTHKGSLNLEWKGNYGGWGGAVYRQWIYENTSQYTTLLAGTQLVDNSYAMAFFLRGGGTTGAIYHFASDQPLTWTDSYLTYTEPTAFYNQEKTFDYSNDASDKYAPAPKTTVDTNQLNSITVVKGDDSRLTNARTPTTHSHPKSQITNFDNEVLALSPAGARTPTTHSHTKAQITDFAHTHPKSQITNFDSEVLALSPAGARPPTTHQHNATDINFGRFSRDRLPLGTAGTVLKGNDLLSPVWEFISWDEVQGKPTILPIDEGSEGLTTTAHTISAQNLVSIIQNISPPGARTPLSHTLNSHSGTLSLTKGGTGSTTASGARSNLGLSNVLRQVSFSGGTLTIEVV